MAHENIDQRRLWVAERYNEGYCSADIISNGLKLFDCSHSAIYNDLKHFGFPPRKPLFKLDRNPGVYSLTMFDGSVYIGASNRPYYRLLNHLSLLKNQKHKCKQMQELFNINDNIEFKVLIECEPFDLFKQETIQIHIFKMQGCKLLNKNKINLQE